MGAGRVVPWSGGSRRGGLAGSTAGHISLVAKELPNSLEPRECPDLEPRPLDARSRGSPTGAPRRHIRAVVCASSALSCRPLVACSPWHDEAEGIDDTALCVTRDAEGRSGLDVAARTPLARGRAAGGLPAAFDTFDLWCSRIGLTGRDIDNYSGKSTPDSTPQPSAARGVGSLPIPSAAGRSPRRSRLT